MKLLEDRIIKDGVVYGHDVLKVGSFLNHCIDVPFMQEVCKEFYELFKDSGVTKIVTIEASGIGVACITAAYFGCPVVFAKKQKTTNISDNVYSSQIMSFTHNVMNTAIIEKDKIKSEDRVLIIDDFLARGEAFAGLIDLVRQAGATPVGCGAVIEKSYQDGADRIRKLGVRVESLARIASMDNGKITFLS